MKKVVLLFLLLGWAVLKINATTAPIENDTEPPDEAFVITATNGQKISFFLSVHPIISYFENDLTILTDTSTYLFTIPIADINTCSFEMVSYGIRALQTNECEVRIINETLVIKQSKPNSPVSLYDVNGKKILITFTNASGEAIISMHSLSQGINIIKVNNTNLKISKR